MVVCILPVTRKPPHQRLTLKQASLPESVSARSTVGSCWSSLALPWRIRASLSVAANSLN